MTLTLGVYFVAMGYILASSSPADDSIWWRAIYILVIVAGYVFLGIFQSQHRDMKHDCEKLKEEIAILKNTIQKGDS